MSTFSVGDEGILDWINAEMGDTPGRIVLGWRDDTGEPLGGFLIEGYTGKGGSCRIHFAGRPGWLTRDKLSVLGRYVVGHLGCARAYGHVAAGDVGVLAIDKRLGFEVVCTLKNYFPDDDLVILELTREGAEKWLTEPGPKAFCL